MEGEDSSSEEPDVRWLPTFPLSEDSAAAPDEMVMPVFFLGESVYLPGARPDLNIFEPRYCEMYNNIIMNGSRRFVVPLLGTAPAPPDSSAAAQDKRDSLQIAEVGLPTSFLCLPPTTQRYGIEPNRVQ